MARVGVDLMLNGHLVQQQQSVLHLGIPLVSVLTTKIVQPLDLVQDKVDDRNEDSDTDGIRPDDHNSDKIRMPVGRVLKLCFRNRVHNPAAAARQPAEDAEDGRQHVHDKDGADELPRGPSLGAARDEDEPVLGERDLEEQDFLDRAEVLDHAAVGQEHGAADDPGRDGEQAAEYHADDPDLAELPFDGAGLDVGVIVGYGDGGKIGEEGALCFVSLRSRLRVEEDVGVSCELT